MSRVVKNVHRSRQSVRSYNSDCVSLRVVGGGEGIPRLGFDFDGELMVLPVPDSYEQLASKVFMPV